MKRSKLLSATALLGVVLVLAAACSSSSSSTGGNTGGGNDATAKCAADKFGCDQYGPGQPIQLGTLLAISGNVAFLGMDSQHGAQLALDYLDGKFDGKFGQVDGHTFKMVNEDDGCSKDGGQAGAQKLVSIPNIVAVIGTSCSSAALGVADKALSDKGIILLSPSATNPNLTAQGTHQPFFFRTAHNDKIQGAVVADFAYTKLGLTSAATIHDESPYADALAAVFRDDFVKLGGTITPNGNQAIQSSDTDFHSVLTTIAGDSPQFLYYPDFDPACALITKQAKEISGLSGATLMGSDGCLESAFLQTAGSSASGFYASGPDFSALKTTNAFYANQFLPAYQSQFGTAPTAAFHAHAYDAVNILVAAIKKVAIDQGGTLYIPRTALRDALQATSGYKGITGTISCTPLGDCATSVSIGVYKAPDWPVEGGTGPGNAVFEETKTLAQAG